MRARTRCFRCNQIGHWKKECPSRGKPPSTSSSSHAGTTSSGKPSVPKEVHIIEEGEMEDPGDAYSAMVEMMDQSIEDEFDDFGVHYTDAAERSDVTLDSFHSEVVGHFYEDGKALSGVFHPVSLDRPGNQYETGIDLTGVCRARNFEALSAEDDEVKEAYMSAALDSHGVPDTACRRSLIGECVLEKL